MSFPAYREYEDTGFDWLQRTPSRWCFGRLRWLAKIYAGGTPDKKNKSFWTGGTVPWLNSGAVNQPLVTEPSAFITEEALQNSSAKWVPRDALVIALAGQGKTKGMVAQIKLNTTCNQSMAAIIPTDRLKPRYLFWWLSSNYQNIRNLSGGDLRDGLNLQLLGTIGCPLPSLCEQHAIASFLDRETSKIDALVAEQRRLIELLKEKRQAVISHAVTKGLDPTVPMKDSEIEWLGEVPEHWAMTRLGRACDYISYGFTNPMPTADEGPYMITANDVDYGNVKYDSARRTTADAFDNLLTDKCRPTENDLLLTKDGTLGRIAIHDGRQACINQSVALLRVIKSRVIPEFACLALQGGIYQRRMIYEAGGTTIKHIYISRLAKMPMAFPGLVEQGEIVECLNDRLAKFNGLIAEAERAIDLLQERRAALISAAVTGKIDVRDHALQETA